MSSFIRCNVSHGMFSDERVIELTLKTGKVVAFIVQSTDVIEDGDGNGKLRVWVDSSGAECLAVLPTLRRDPIRCEQKDFISA